MSESNNHGRVQPWAIWTAVVGMLVSLFASGSTGMLSHGLRHTTTWVGAGIVLWLTWRGLDAPTRRAKALFTYLIIVVGFTYFSLTTSRLVNMLTFVCLLAVVATAQRGKERVVLDTTVAAVFTLSLYKLLLALNPHAYLLSSSFVGALSRAAGWLVREELNAGPTVAGMDQLVLVVAWCFAWSRATSPFDGKRLSLRLASIIAIHLLYLTAVARLAAYGAGIVEDPEGKGSSLASLAQRLLPWQLPTLLTLAYGVFVYTVASSSRWPGNATLDPKPGRTVAVLRRRPLAVALPSAVVLVALSILSPGDGTGLQDKKIVFNKRGFLNWLVPQHGDYGRLSIGMYGMLPDHLDSMGAQFRHTEDFSEEDLRDADALVLIFPEEPWKEGELERIWAFVRNGGSLLVLAEHTVQGPDGGSRFNELLSPSAIRVNFDSSMFRIGGWLMSYDAISHPVTSGFKDSRNQMGFVIGASLRAGWPAKPLVIGRWGWSDVGDPSGNAMMGNSRYDPGEKLGDLLLAAEQTVGTGRVVVFGDTSSFTNGIMIGSADFTSRVLAYLTEKTPHDALDHARYVLLTLLVFVILFVSADDGTAIALCSVTLAALLVAATAATYQSRKLVPSRQQPNDRHIAYVDTSHNHVFSSESWRPEGIMGLYLNLMRSGYLVLSMPRFDANRLDEADMFVILAPQKAYYEHEISAIENFVARGGTLVVAAGFTERAFAGALLQRFGFSLAPEGERPLPMGHFKAPYLDVDTYLAYVRFHAGWPVHSDAPNQIKRALGPGDRPVIVERPIGEGYVVVVGDSGFALNRNLENENGEPFENSRENADYWRWLATFLKKEEIWVPAAQ